MSKLSEKEIKAALKADLKKCQSVFNGQKVRVYRSFRLDDGLYDLIIFKNGSSVASKTPRHTVYIEFGEYLIQAQIPNLKLSECVDFSKSTIYNITTGIVLNTTGCPDIGIRNKCDILVVDSRILVICREKNTPQFYIMMDKNLVEVKPHLAEHLLNIADFSKEHATSLVNFYPEEDWSINNGLVLNYACGFVPSQMQLEVWKKSRHVHVNIKKGIDPKRLLSVFTSPDGEAV